MNDRDIERMFALDGAPGPARPIDARVEAAIVTAALAGAGFAPVPGGGGGGGSSGGGAAAGGSGAKLALLLGGGAAITAAAIIAYTLARRPREQTIETRTPATATESVAASGSATATAATGPVYVDVPPILVHKPAAAPPPTAPAHAHHVETQAPPAATETPAPAPAAAPADLLALANAARAAKQWAKADALYAQVAASPDHLAAETALVADGQLRLEHLGDAKGAIDRFRAALDASPAGALAEDARWGLADAYRARRDARAEAKALDDFLAHHADSPLAARARARRQELGAP